MARMGEVVAFYSRLNGACKFWRETRKDTTMAEQWKLGGTYFEACNCATACPCLFLSAPTEGECTIIVAWHIDEGNFGDVDLDGLNVALAVHSPGHMMEVDWKAALYLDERANQDQKDALTQIFGGQAGGHPARLGEHIGEVLGAESVAIEYHAEGKQRSIRIGTVAEVDIEAVAGQNGADITISNHLLAIAPGYPGVLAKSSRLTYQDHGYEWELSGKNGLYSPFTYQGT